MSLENKAVRQFLPLYTVIFFSFLGYALTIALFIPMMMDAHFALLPGSTSASARMMLSGLLLAMYPLGQFLGAPMIGSLSDYFGRKKILTYSLVACTFGFIGVALSIEFHQLILLFIFSFLTGVCESNMAISQSVITDSTAEPVQRTKLIGYAYSACSLGYISGPLLGGSIGSVLGYSAPFWITAFGIFILMLWVWYGFNDNYIPTKEKTMHILKSMLAIFSIFKHKTLLPIYFINFSIFFSIQGLYRVAPIYVMDQWQLSLHMYSLMIASLSALCLLANLALLGKLATRFPTQKLLSGLLLISGVLVIGMIIPQNFHGFWVIYGLAAIPTVMALPLCTSWLSHHAAADEQGQVLGNNQALLVLGEASSAAIGGFVAAIFLPLPLVMMGSILLMMGVLVIFRVTSKKGNSR